MPTVNWLKVPPPRTLLPRRPDAMPHLRKALTRKELLALIKQHRAAIIASQVDRAPAFERGRSRWPERLHEVRDRVFAGLAAGRLPRTLRSRVEAAIAVMASGDACALFIPYWVACRGLHFAVLATARWASLEVVTQHVGSKLVAWVTLRGHPVFEPSLGDASFANGPWLALRAAVADADPETYEEARQIAEKIRRRACPAVSCGLAFAFPSEHEWARQDAIYELARCDRNKDQGAPDHMIALLASLRDPALAERIVRVAVDRCSADEAGDLAWEMVANLGMHAERPLVLLDHKAALERLRAALKTHMSKVLEGVA
jgi:hypothetical protein